MNNLTLTNARLIDGTGSQPRNNTTIIVRSGRIEAVREGAEQAGEGGVEVIDVGGRTVLPGLINAHCHITMNAGADPFAYTRGTSLPTLVLHSLKRCQLMLEAGITTARDLGGYEYIEMALRDAFASGDWPGPRLLCAGKVLTMTGGHGWPIGMEVDGPDEVRKGARENLKHGADCLKIMATGGVLTPGVEPGAQQLGEDEIRAGVEEAHKVGKLAATHAQGTEGIKAALRAGIDTVEHGIFLDDEAIQIMVERGVVFVPTLAAPYQIVDAGEEKGIPAYALEKSRRVMQAHFRSFEWAVSAGVTIAAGNDGGTPFNPSHDLVTELRLMTEHGLNTQGALKAATWGSAKALGLSEEIGTVQAGKWADLLVLDEGADPVVDISSLSLVWMVVKQGKVVVRK
ncbi:MAG: amidohydrolase family protein [Chloroflexota bacterium]|nr:amidohydrolase family protein [Chloroflexota bacterium]